MMTLLIRPSLASAGIFAFYGLVAFAGLAVACFWPTILAEADDYLPVNTTILMVLLACAGNIGFGLTPWIMGLIGDSSELRLGFAIIPLLFIILVVLLIAERRLSEKRTRQLEPEKTKSPVV